MKISVNITRKGSCALCLPHAHAEKLAQRTGLLACEVQRVSRVREGDGSEAVVGE
jgi:hypothetical protein